VSLLTSYIYLAWNIKLYFAKELQDEGNRIKGIFVFFSLSYISRGTVFLLVQIDAIEHVAVVYYTMYFFWDVLPLCLIMRFHYKCFKAQDEYNRRASSAEVSAPQEDSSSASSSVSSSSSERSSNNDSSD